MKIPYREKRLYRFYGDVASYQNRDIINLITGKKILDIGCGYGTLINQIKKERSEVEVTGIDIDPQTSKIAKDLYNIEVKNYSVYRMNFSDNFFDTVILREVIHHFNVDDNLEFALKEIKRVCKKEVIIFDPNPIWLLRFCRRLIRHKDPEASIGTTIKSLEGAGFNIKFCKWRDILAFPLSGGLVGLEFVPNISFIKKMVIKLDFCLNLIFYKLRIQKFFCWRYLIYATTT